MSDIIDNRRRLLINDVKDILGSTEFARFAVGYFFVSGFAGLAESFGRVKQIRLLIGNTTNRETIEQIAEGYSHLDPVRDEVERQFFRKRSDASRAVDEAARNVREVLELNEQNTSDAELISTVVEMIKQQRLKVRVYTKGRLHAKAYIFDYHETVEGARRYEKGIAIVGSSNLTLAGISQNTELNVVVPGNTNHAELSKWFDELWDESEDFDEQLMNEMKQSWALARVTPRDIFLKTVYNLTHERLHLNDPDSLLWSDDITDKLADFQKIAVQQALRIIKLYGGAFISDVVGLGKSFIGAAIVKHFETTEQARPLIICPASLVDIWEKYNENYTLNARVLSLGYLRDDDRVGNRLLDDSRFRDRNFVLIDESHQFRHPDTQRYQLLQSFLASGRRACLLTATPRNKTVWDVYHQIKLFHADDATSIPIDPPNLKQFFKEIERGNRHLPAILSHILIRRTRNHILRWYGFDEETGLRIDPNNFDEYLSQQKRGYVYVAGKKQFFPRRELITIEYSIEQAYRGLYQRLRSYLTAGNLSSLSLARYSLWDFVKATARQQEPYGQLKSASANLRGLVRILLFKRLESSVYAFTQTIRRLHRIHELFMEALSRGIVPAGADAQSILYESDELEEGAIMDALEAASSDYKLEHFDQPRLEQAILDDKVKLAEMLSLIEVIGPEQDAKLQTLVQWLDSDLLKSGKKLVFTQYADTAQYLFEYLKRTRAEEVEVIYSTEKQKGRIISRFAPKSNPEYQISGDEIQLLIATDVLAEGLNLQDCDKIINYDLHWNPVRLIQRFGRIDRIGTEYSTIYGLNFLPELEVERTLQLRARLQNRIQEIHDTIGEDSAILDLTETVNPNAMYAIYEQNASELESLDIEHSDMLQLSEAEEILRQLMHDDPSEFQRIGNLRDGVRTAAEDGTIRGVCVLCQAGTYKQLYLCDPAGNVLTSDVPTILGVMRKNSDRKARNVPASEFSEVLAKVKQHFRDEVIRRQAELGHSLQLSQAQRYVIRELQILFNAASDENLLAKIRVLEAAIRRPLTMIAKKELNRLRLQSLTGDTLLRAVERLYHLHNLKDVVSREAVDMVIVPKIVCSALLL